jgi:predicted ArsR family transcriptional regulator
MLGTLVLALGVVTLVLVGGTWHRERVREFEAELRAELLQKLKRRPAHSKALLDELRRSGSVRAPRVIAALRQLELDGIVACDWREGGNGRPHRVYTLTGNALPAEPDAAEAVVVSRRS